MQNQSDPQSEMTNRLLQDIQRAGGILGAHLTDEEFASYSAGVLNDNESIQIERHLLSCEICCDAMEQLTEAVQVWDSDSGTLRLSELVKNIRAQFSPTREAVLSTVILPTTTQTVPSGILSHLAAALQVLLKTQPDQPPLQRWLNILDAPTERSPSRIPMHSRLQRWLNILQVPTAPAVEVAAHIEVRPSQDGWAQILPDISRPGMQPLLSHRGADNTATLAGSVINATSEPGYAIQIRVEESNVRVVVLDWTSAFPPIVVLIPDQATVEPRMPTTIDEAENEWTAHFPETPVGSYLIAIAPLEA